MNSNKIPEIGLISEQKNRKCKCCEWACICTRPVFAFDQGDPERRYCTECEGWECRCTAGIEFKNTALGKELYCGYCTYSPCECYNLLTLKNKKAMKRKKIIYDKWMINDSPPPDVIKYLELNNIVEEPIVLTSKDEIDDEYWKTDYELFMKEKGISDIETAKKLFWVEWEEMKENDKKEDKLSKIPENLFIDNKQYIKDEPSSEEDEDTEEELDYIPGYCPFCKEEGLEIVNCSKHKNDKHVYNPIIIDNKKEKECRGSCTCGRKFKFEYGRYVLKHAKECEKGIEIKCDNCDGNIEISRFNQHSKFCKSMDNFARSIGFKWDKKSRKWISEK